MTRKLFITLDCAIQWPRVPDRARAAAARKNVNNKRETRKHFLNVWSLMPRSCSISLNGGIPMLRICFALIVYIHGYHFVTAPPRRRFAPMHADALRVRHLPRMSHRSRRLAALQPSRRHRASLLIPRAIEARAMILPGMAFWDVTMVSVLARLGRNNDEIARNGVLGRCEFFGPSQARTT